MIELEEITVDLFIENYEVIKRTFDGLLSPFFDAKTIKEWKIQLYKSKMAQWKQDKIWEVLNGDYTLDEFKIIIQCTK